MTNQIHIGYESIIKVVNPTNKNNPYENLLFGIQFKKPLNSLILYKQHLYSLFLLLFYHGELAHMQMLIDKAEQCKLLQQSNLSEYKISDEENISQRQQFVKSQYLIQALAFTIASISNPASNNTFHSLAQRQKFRKSIKAICEMTNKLIANKNNNTLIELSLIDFAKLAGSLINVNCIARDYHDFQIVEFQCELFRECSLQVFIQISKQNQTYRYIKQSRSKKLNQNYKSEHHYQYGDENKKIGSQFSMDSYGSLLYQKFRYEQSEEQVLQEQQGEQEEQYMEQSVVARSAEQIQQSLQLKKQKSNLSNKSNKSGIKNINQSDQKLKFINMGIVETVEQPPKSSKIFKQDEITEQFSPKSKSKQKSNMKMLVSQTKSLELPNNQKQIKQQTTNNNMNHYSEQSKNIKNPINIQPKIFNSIGQEVQSQTEAFDVDKKSKQLQQQKQRVRKAKKVLQGTSLLAFLKSLNKKDYKQYQKQLDKFGNLMKSKMGVQWLEGGFSALESQVQQSSKSKKQSGFAAMIKTIIKQNEEQKPTKDNSGKQQNKDDINQQKQLQDQKQKTNNFMSMLQPINQKIKQIDLNVNAKKDDSNQKQEQTIKQTNEQIQRQRQKSIDQLRQKLKQREKQIEQKRKNQKNDKSGFIRQFAQKQMRNNMNTLKIDKKQLNENINKTQNRFSTKLFKDNQKPSNNHNSQQFFQSPIRQRPSSNKQTQNPQLSTYRSLDHSDRNNEKYSYQYPQNLQINDHFSSRMDSNTLNTNSNNIRDHLSLNKHPNTRNYSPSSFYTELCLKYRYQNYIPRSKRVRYDY